MNPLYIIPTPIGNLEDITVRSLNILKNSDLVLCEDTRRTSKLLNHYSIKKKLISFHKDNELMMIDKILDLLKTNVISLVSDAGTPAISDPGSKLIKKLNLNGMKVIPLPGPSSITTAFSASGLDGDFIFVGFLPKNLKSLTKNLINLSQINKNIILFESPKRIMRLLNESRKIFKKSNLIIFKELTKINEKIIYLKPEDSLSEIDLTRGEYILIIENIELNNDANNYSEEDIVCKLNELLNLKFSGKDSIKISSNYLGINQKKIYNIYLKNFNN
tara:strand:+ start:2448 stop:3272 length:825 start_codon:yes stop_codon:yes gene_type:complete